MSYKKRLVVFLMCISMLAVTIPAQAQEDEVLITPIPCEAPGELTMWIWSTAWEPIIQETIDIWEETYCPGAHVTLTQIPWTDYWSALGEAAENDELPDIFNINQPFFYDYASPGYLLNLQPYWDANEVDTALWGSGLIGPYRWGEDDDLYAGPVNWDTIVVFYNKDMLDAAEMPYPSADWDWNLFAGYAEALTDPENDVYGALIHVGYQTGYGNWIAATGTSPIVDAARTRCTLTDEGSIEAFTFMKDLLDAGYMPRLSIIDETKEPIDIKDSDAFNFWAAERVAMLTAGSFTLPNALSEDVEFNWGVVQLPRHPETGRSRSVVHSVGYVASANTEQPDLTANFIHFLVSDEAQALFAQAGGVAPANPSPALQQMWIDSFGETEVDIGPFISATFDSQGITAFGAIWDLAITGIVVDVFENDIDIEEAMQAACETIEANLPGAEDADSE